MMDSVTIGRSPVQKFGADHAGPTIYDDALKRPPCGEDNVMSVIMGLLVVSALAGLVLGFYFELAALAVSGLILSVSAAMNCRRKILVFLRESESSSSSSLSTKSLI